jgi:biopolymer transport protein TolR
MVVVSMSGHKGLEAQIPQPSHDQAAPPPERTIIIQVLWKGKDQQPMVKINEEQVAWKDAEGRLRTIFAPRIERVAFVRGDGDINFEKIADVIDSAHAAGVQHVGLLRTTP